MWDNKDAFNADREDLNWWWGRARMEILRQSVQRLAFPGMTILEIGAGFGRMTGMLSSFGTVKAIEPHPEAAAYLQNELRVQTFNGTMESYDGTEKFDLVTCFDALEHIEDDAGALARMGTLAKENGSLILTVPAYQFLWSRHDEVNHHFRRYDRKQLIGRLPGSLVIRKASYFNTLLFPMAVLDKTLLSRNGKSRSLDPNRMLNTLLYRVFSLEKPMLRYLSFPFGVSILLIAEKRSPARTAAD